MNKKYWLGNRKGRDPLGKLRNRLRCEGTIKIDTNVMASQVPKREEIERIIFVPNLD
jgi:hypothetical protein